ncbi:hypothetical protein BASA81_000088 [Batrachochytrium salamandrivorans]|nr:hypothetical protein BASA81_000088 [Batrachochytrium salamandrivorans]
MGCCASLQRPKQPSPEQQAAQEKQRRLSKENLAVSLQVSSAAEVNQRRLSMALDLVNSGRPISVSITQDFADENDGEAPTFSLKRTLKLDNKKDSTTASEQKQDDENWTGQLSLMRKFYDWEEIPMDFFVDQQVSGGGLLPGIGGAITKPKKRMSVQIVALSEEEAAGPAPPGALFVNRDRGMSEMM